MMRKPPINTKPTNNKEADAVLLLRCDMAYNLEWTFNRSRFSFNSNRWSYLFS
jgi:hypothetical protein